MLDLALPIYRFNLVYSQKLVADVPDDQMCVQPVAGRVMNHAAFVLGHLAWASDNALTYLESKPTLGPEWKGLFGMTTLPQSDRSAYPAKDALLSALEGAHERLAAALSSATTEALSQPAPERMRARFPSLGHMLLGLMTAHEAAHNGQLSAWRRALGYPSVF
jgi:hypothetical protein